ncbi:MAG: hypothetical protein KF901_31105 [Myxococcales bacterium]|nr:hypothetical protein [Myxococcales bacterium]
MIQRRYVDPLDAIWLATAAALGLRVTRTPDAFASTNGTGELALGTPETLDADDCLAQMIFHEVCHWLVQGEDAFHVPDWGLDNESDRDLAREHACLRVQAALLAPLGLREVFAPTTDFRIDYDALPADPLEGAEPTVRALAVAALARASTPPWAPHLSRALDASAAVVAAVVAAGAASREHDGLATIFAGYAAR